MNLIELNGADVVRGGRRILDDVTLAVRDGEHTAILGPNGAGKSTLIKLVTLQLYPVAREDGVPPIRVFEQERWDVFALRSRLGIVSADLHDRFVHGNANGIVTGTTNWSSFSEIAFSFRVTPALLLVGMIFAVVMGIVGGFFPALRAQVATRPLIFLQPRSE